MTGKRVVVVGSGGREHAYQAVLARTADVVVTPGNPGIPGSVATPAEDLDADLFVVGPEQPLVGGLADRLRRRGRLVFGPGADGAELEGSKKWMKDVVAAAGVPTAAYAAFTADQLDEALAYLRATGGPYVIKTDGLAAGKGVLVTENLAEAEADVHDKLSGAAFGESGTTIIIEEALDGPEISFFALCDGTKAVPIATLAQDHKRVGDGNIGPNTGGMGCYSPVPGVEVQLVEELMAVAIDPTVAELRRRGIDYRGVLFAGFMLTTDGPKLLEYNIRFGDPEAQVVLPRIEGDVVELLSSVAAGAVHEAPTVSSDAMVTVVLASEGYPISPRTGDKIEGLAAAEALDGVQVFCAGIGRVADSFTTSGGRVLNVTARAADVESARSLAYEACSLISWPGMVMRTDIAAVTPATPIPTSSRSITAMSEQEALR